MATCRQCGREISFWSGYFCTECRQERGEKRAEEKRRAQTEARRKEEQKARAALRAFFAEHAPGESARILGAAYWTTMGSMVGTGVAKMIFGGWGGSEHRAGVVAVTDSDLVLVDLGTVVGDLTIGKMKHCAAIDKPSVKRAPLSSLAAECDSQAGVLTLKGGLKVKATFPASFAGKNPSKAALIARAVQANS
jgi:hypothetical protein